MAGFDDAQRMRVNVVVPQGELPCWLGAALLAIDAWPRVQLGLERSAGMPSEALTRPDRWWRSRIALLGAWRPAGAALDRVRAWHAAGESAAVATFSVVDAWPRSAGADPIGDARRFVITGEGGCTLWNAFPLLDPITAGRGIRLECRPCGTAAPSLDAQVHVAATPRYARAVAALAPSLCRLVAQVLADLPACASVDPHDGAATGRVPALPVPAPTPPPTPTPTPAAPESTLPRRHAGVPALVHGVRGRARAWVERQRSLWLSEYWRLGVIDAPLAQCLVPGPLPAVKWITPQDASGYWADPFGVPGEPRELVCEHFDERRGIGQIDHLRFDARDALVGRTRLQLGAGRHVSFPNLFELAGRRLGLLEAASSGNCVLYEIDAAGAWRPLATVLGGVAAADPAMFEFEGRFWLAYTDLGVGSQDNLCLQHAPRLEGPWRPHAANPVKVDIGAARMAGNPCWHGGALYRPAQDCLRGYGAAVVVHRIEVLTPERFKEVFVRRIEPDARGACPDGLHTLSAWGERTLVDGKRMGVNPRVLARKLARRLAAALRLPSAG